MNLSFDSIDDLNHFLSWADRFRSGMVPLAAPGVLTSADVRASVNGTRVLPCSEADATLDVAFDTPTSPESGEATPPAQQAADSPEPAKRKRRTKAEIEADAERTRTEGQAVLEQIAGAPQPEVAQGANPFDQPATDAGASDDKTAETPPADVDGGESVVTPFQHLTRAREFIAKHGMPKYNESFTKAGLDANVMGYSAFQRALHITALDELEKA